MVRWIKMDCELWENPKVRRMGKLLRKPRPTVIGALFAAWSIADRHARGDVVEGMNAELLDEHVEVAGFAAAMEAVGWLVIDHDAILFPEYENHNGTTEKQRLTHAQRAARARSKSALPRTPVGDASALPRTRREEKRGEEIRKEQPPVVGGEPSQDGLPPAGDEPTEFCFPVEGNGGDEWTLPLSKLFEYRETYPHLDVDAELRAARQWCRDNPANRKTAGGMPRFLGNWLKKAQNNPSLRAKTGPAAGSEAAAKKYRPIDPPV